jgi:hypothetical protein
MRMSHCLGALLAGLALLFVGATARADDGISFKKKVETDKAKEKEFYNRVAVAVIKAGRPTAKKAALIDYKISNPKVNRTELVLNADYQGVVSGLVSKKRIPATITLIIDSTNPKAWEVLNSKYEDGSKAALGANAKKIQDLIAKMNE